MNLGGAKRIIDVKHLVSLLTITLSLVVLGGCSQGSKINQSLSNSDSSASSSPTTPLPTPSPNPTQTPAPSPSPTPTSTGTLTPTGKSYYVSPTGSDSNAGTSTSSPFQTIAHATSVMQAGDGVYIMSGTYNESIAPARSGTAGHPIIYQNYAGSTPVINVQNSNGQAILTNMSYIIIGGITFQNAPNMWIEMDGSSHIRITTCTFTTANGWSGIDMWNGASYGQIDHNTFTATCSGGNASLIGSNSALPGGTGGPNDTIGMATNTTNMLIDSNTFNYAGHYAIDLQGGTQNVIQNNYVNNPWHGDIGLYFTDGSELYDNVIQNNTIVNTGSSSSTNLCRTWTNVGSGDGFGLEVSATQAIIRGNIFLNNGVTAPVVSGGDRGSIGLTTFGGNAENVYTYNNSFSNNYDSVYIWGDVGNIGGYDYTNIFANNVFKNNIFSQDQAESFNAVSDGSLGKSVIANNDVYSQQIVYRSTTGSLSTIQSTYSSEWQNNVNVNPQFVNASSGNLQLASGSPALNAGTFLTTVVGSGTSTTVVVADSGYFTNGYGIIQGDIIQLQGSTQRAQVISVNRSINTLTLSMALTFTNGQGVALSYSGSAPNMGAY